eukprot:NODE_561_length_6036_cov_1.205491.p6 type:complete len:124 gc:universal NODE_561_length_6036_cov_1.205491:3074-2703(-)
MINSLVANLFEPYELIDEFRSQVQIIDKFIHKNRAYISHSLKMELKQAEAGQELVALHDKLSSNHKSLDKFRNAFDILSDLYHNHMTSMSQQELMDFAIRLNYYKRENLKQTEFNDLKIDQEK